MLAACARKSGRVYYSHTCMCGSSGPGWAGVMGGCALDQQPPIGRRILTHLVIDRRAATTQSTPQSSTAGADTSRGAESAARACLATPGAERSQKTGAGRILQGGVAGS